MFHLDSWIKKPRLIDRWSAFNRWWADNYRWAGWKSRRRGWQRQLLWTTSTSFFLPQNKASNVNKKKQGWLLRQLRGNLEEDFYVSLQVVRCMVLVPPPAASGRHSKFQPATATLGRARATTVEPLIACFLTIAVTTLLNINKITLVTAYFFSSSPPQSQLGQTRGLGREQER